MKNAVMYGAGNIGRGFIGQLFSESGYEVAFLDINPVIIDKLNSDRCYPVRIISDNKYTEIDVKNVRGVNSTDINAVAEEIANADIMATAIGVNILPRIAKPIAFGLKRRWEIGNKEPLNIIICENLLDANLYLARLIKEELTDSEQKLFDETIGLVEASIGRMVPVMTTEMQEGNPLRICVEEFCELPVDKDGFKGSIPNIKNMVPFTPFSFYIQRKLYMHNMGHAVTAYLGYLAKDRYIWEACKKPVVKLCALRALQESSLAMSKEHGVELEKLLDHSDDLLYRFGNQLLGDTIDRVGKDPIRKLSINDRLLGSASLCIKQGIMPVYICIGIAAAFIFNQTGDESADKIQTFIKENGIGRAIFEFCSIKEDSKIYKYIIKFYDRLKSGANLDQIVLEAENLKRN